MTGPDATRNPGSTVRIPPEHLYWAIVEAKLPRRSGVADRDGLLALAQDDLPVEADRVHAVYTRLDDTRLLVCAVHAETLRALPAGTLRCTPSSIPDFASGGDPELLNLLVGSFEPAPLAAVRRRARSILFAGVILAIGLAALGLWRRAGAWEESRRATIAARDAALALAGADSPAQLRARVERAGAAAVARRSPDAATPLAELLSAWPKTDAEVTLLTVTPQTISLNAIVPEDAKGFVESLAAPQGFTADPPRVSSTPRGAGVAVQFRRAKGGS